MRIFIFVEVMSHSSRPQVIGNASVNSGQAIAVFTNDASLQILYGREGVAPASDSSLVTLHLSLLQCLTNVGLDLLFGIYAVHLGDNNSAAVDEERDWKLRLARFCDCTSGLDIGRRTSV